MYKLHNVISILLNKDKIVIRIKEKATHDSIVDELKEKMPKLKRFYQDEKVPILVTGKVLQQKDMDEIKRLINKSIDVKVEFDKPTVLGLQGIKQTYRQSIGTSPTKFYKISLRSGQKIEFEGSIVILGDVNHGAEVIAEDNIVVLGNLRGMAHAGAKGNQEAIISAHVIDSPQIRIASNILERSREEIESQAFTYAFVNQAGNIEMTR